MRVEAIARLAAVTIAGFGAVILIGAGWIPGVKPDADAYWLAALRLREGEPLYLPAAAYADEIDIYRYAPWFAYAWVPLTYLPQESAYLVWRALLAAGAVAAVLPILRRLTPAGLVLTLLIFSLLVSNLPAANVTALLVGALAVSLRTRAGPVVLGLAGSLKIFPLLLVFGYVAERRWRDAVVAVGVAAILWAHLLAFRLENYPTEFGGVGLYRLAAWLWPVVAVAAVVVIGGLAHRRSRWTWLAAGAAIPLAVPRIWLPDAAYTATAVGPTGTSAGGAPAARPGTARTSPRPRPDPA
ncbi:MAG TPA: glycosyltransferase 87 family protein [candidate division Zixibacteria bacterium]|nr:glycosyltransferase 87 family protein [candidate division Zixibacteria bacterium]